MAALLFWLVWIIPSSPAAAEETVDPLISRWLDEFQPCALSRAEQQAELSWFREAGKPFRGEKIRSAAETLPLHYWERDVLARAFKDITGIEVEHVIIHEGDVVRRITEQMVTGRLLFDIYVNDADFIGTHLRLNKVVNLSEYMAGEGKAYTDPYLDTGDFLNLEFGQDYEGNQLQLPDNQFANLYWFRHDWFSDEATREAFRREYGYELGVPVNWAAYEDIAEFFTGRRMENPDGSTVTAYGHCDWGAPGPALGWRFTDSWFSIAGMGDRGLPNGLPVDEWGIRVEERIPRGSMVERGGALDGPAAVYALSVYLDWLERFAPPEAKQWDTYFFGLVPARGDIAQVIFQYTTFLADEKYHRPGSPMVDGAGKPVWRVAPTPHGRYWEEGMKVGYQDAGSWTIPSNVRGKRRAMAWLWAQFCVSKSVAVKRFVVNGAPVRRSTLAHPYVNEHAADWGGIVEFYRSPDENKWTDSGVNVPYYPALSGLWWSIIARAVSGELTPQQTMTTLARAQDDILAKLKLNRYPPNLNPLRSREYWLNRPGAPKPERRQRPVPETILYEDLIRQWREGQQ